MDIPRYRIGNDLTVLWAICNNDGTPFDLSGKVVRLFVTNDKGITEVKPTITSDKDGSANNVILWNYLGDDQKVLGKHTLTVEILTSDDKRKIKRDVCDAFTLVSRSESEETGGDANFMDSGSIYLSTKLDVYRFGNVRVEIGTNGNWFIDGYDTGKTALGGGPGLVNIIYKESDLGGEFQPDSVIDTFNANAINAIYKALKAISLKDISNISLANLAAYDVLTYNGSNWINLPFKDLINLFRGPSESGSDTPVSGDSYWILGEEDGKLYSNYDIYVRGNAVIEGDTSSGGDGQDTPAAGGSLSNLRDVSLSSLSEGDVLVYDKDNGVWYNVPQSKIVPNLEGYAKQTWVTENFLKSDTLDEYKEELGKEVKEISELLNSMWRIEDNKIVTDMDVLVKKNLIVEGDTSSGGEGEDTPAEGTVTGIEVNGTPYEPNTQGVIDLSDAFKAIDVSDQLKDYYTQTQTDSAISTAIANLINGAPTTLDTLKEIADALAENEDVVDALEEAIGKKADNTTVTALAERVSTNEGAIDALDKRVTAEEAVTTTYASWWSDLKKYIKVEGDNVKIDTNLIVEGDTSSGGSGQDTPASGTVTGIKVNGKTYEPIAGIVTIPDYPTSLTWSAISGKPSFATVATSGKYSDLSGLPTIPTNNNQLTNGAGYITSAALVGYATQSWVEGKGYLTSVNSEHYPALNDYGSYIGFDFVSSFKSKGQGSGYIEFYDSGWYNFHIGSLVVNGSAYVNGNEVYHTGNFNPANYLPLSGGTIEGNYDVLKIKRNANYASLIKFENTSGSMGYLGFSNPNVPAWYSSDVATSYTLIHSGNIGSYAFVPKSDSLVSNVNADNYLSNGVYLNQTGNGSGNSNFPSSYSAFLTFSQSSKYAAQISIGNNAIYMRRKIDTWSHWMRIIAENENGNVLIGTTTDYSSGKLQINGGATLNGYMASGAVSKIADLGEKGLVVATGSDRKTWGMALWTEGTSKGYIQQQSFASAATTYSLCLNPFGGNVGIGNPDPRYALHVNGTTRASAFYSTNIGIECDANGNTSGYGSEINRFGASLYLQPREGNLFLSHSAGTTYIRGLASITGAVTMSSTLSVSGSTSLSSTTITGGLELFHATPFIDFHFGNSSADYTSRIIEVASGKIRVVGALQVAAATELQSTLSVSGNTTINGNLVVSGDVASA